MRIAISSGKGGVGKTFVSTNLAKLLSQSQPVNLIDCDVEAPNSHLFFDHEPPATEVVNLNTVTSIDMEKCNLCGQCAKQCYFNAIAIGKKNAMVFSELCRWCGSCQIVCPQDAIITGARKIGDLFSISQHNINLKWATLQTGAGGMTTKLIDMITSANTDNNLTILDSPPGTSCPVIHTVQQADITVLVSDQTRFGLHDLKLSVSMCRSMNIEPLVIINRHGLCDSTEFDNWITEQELNVIGTIPDNKQIGELYSKGKLVIDNLPLAKDAFQKIADKLISTNNETATYKPIDKKNDYLSDNYSQTDTTTELNNNVSNSKLNEIVVLSGKGGTGKTSIAACFAQLSNSCFADCDVDAADMHLIYNPQIKTSQHFSGGRQMSIDSEKCVSCGECLRVCTFNAVNQNSNSYSISSECEGCGTCMLVCPTDAISTEPSDDGNWYLSSTRAGTLSHATLTPGRENSGKLVTIVRTNLQSVPQTENQSPTILDGSPGTGCPVIASIGGVNYAVFVAEPTVSGLSDLKRIVDLAKHFGIKSGVIINKYDLNENMTAEISSYAKSKNVDILGLLPYSNDFVSAQQESKTILEYSPESTISKAIHKIWKNILNKIN